MARKTVSILLTSKPNFNEHALKYFLLHLNKIQSYYEFVFPLNVKPDIDNYYFNENEEYETEEAFDFFENTIRPKINFEKQPDYIINIITSKFVDNLFFDTDVEIKVALITTCKWEKYFSPPSLFEYLLHCIIACLLFLDDKLDLSSHWETRGCCLDYTYYKEDDRVDIALGYVCDRCKEEIKNKKGKKYFDEITNIISRDWLGEINKNNTVAHNLKKIFKFNINRDSGFNKTVFEKIKEPFLEIPSKTTLLVIGAIIGAIITKIFS